MRPTKALELCRNDSKHLTSRAWKNLIGLFNARCAENPSGPIENPADTPIPKIVKSISNATAQTFQDIMHGHTCLMNTHSILNTWHTLTSSVELHSLSIDIDLKLCHTQLDLHTHQQGRLLPCYQKRVSKQHLDVCHNQNWNCWLCRCSFLRPCLVCKVDNKLNNS